MINYRNAIKVVALGGIWDNFSSVIALGRIVRAERIDAVLAISTIANVHLAQADIPKNVVRVGSEHGYSPHIPLSFHKEWFRRRTYPKLDAIVCPTKEAADYLAQAYPRVRTLGIPNWLTWPLPKGDGSASAAMGRPGCKTFVACGRFDKLKGFPRLIMIFDGLKQQLLDWNLVIVGDGEERALMEAQVDQAKLRDRVFFPGWVADTELAFRSGDLFVFPSVSECFALALVLAEAMACGLPCVSYDCKAGPAEILRDVTAWTVSWCRSAMRRFFRRPCFAWRRTT